MRQAGKGRPQAGTEERFCAWGWGADHSHHHPEDKVSWSILGTQLEQLSFAQREKGAQDKQVPQLADTLVP